MTTRYSQEKLLLQEGGQLLARWPSTIRWAEDTLGKLARRAAQLLPHVDKTGETLTSAASPLVRGQPPGGILPVSQLKLLHPRVECALNTAVSMPAFARTRKIHRTTVLVDTNPWGCRVDRRTGARCRVDRRCSDSDLQCKRQTYEDRPPSKPTGHRLGSWKRGNVTCFKPERVRCVFFGAPTVSVAPFDERVHPVADKFRSSTSTVRFAPRPVNANSIVSFQVRRSTESCSGGCQVCSSSSTRSTSYVAAYRGRGGRWWYTPFIRRHTNGCSDRRKLPPTAAASTTAPVVPSSAFSRVIVSYKTPGGSGGPPRENFSVLWAETPIF